MRTAGAGFVSMLSNERTTLATLWKITREDGTELFFTDHSEDIAHDGDTYDASLGFMASTLNNKSDLSVDSIDVQGFLNVAGVSEGDISSGLYDYASVEVKLINYEGNLNSDFMLVASGKLGEVSNKKEFFLAEIRGLAERVQRQVGQLYSPTCRAILGDAKCKFDLVSGSTEQGTPGTFASVGVDAVYSNQSFQINALSVDSRNIFGGGQVEWITGDNTGLKMEIKSSAQGKLTLVLPMPNTVQVGDTVKVMVGCNKRFSTCVSKFDNAVNFRGEPHVPGIDKILETAFNNSNRNRSGE
jgi:uncharacterized phage protein (TIGR02218 family)